MIYLGVRKRKLNQIHQVKASIQAKLENRVAMTTAVVTIALILSFFPGVIVIILEKVYPALHTRFAWKLSDSLLFLNSLVNPLIYCYRDHRFRNAVLEMLRIRKPTTVSATEAVKFVKRKNSLDPGNVSLQKKEGNPVRLARSASCDLVPFSINQTFNKSRNASLKRTMWAPSVPKDYNSANVKIQKVENWPICLPRSASCDWDPFNFNPFNASLKSPAQKNHASSLSPLLTDTSCTSTVIHRILKVFETEMRETWRSKTVFPTKNND